MSGEFVERLKANCPRLPVYPWPHCGTPAACTMGADEGERCACPCTRCRVARWGVTRSGIYRYRWQWWAPWGVTDWWRPRAFKGGNEWCEVPLCLVVPPLGCLVVYPPRPRRAVPCAECWENLPDWQRADYAPCGRNHGGRVNWAAHDHLDGACEEARAWLAGSRGQAT